MSGIRAEYPTCLWCSEALMDYGLSHRCVGGVTAAHYNAHVIDYLSFGPKRSRRLSREDVRDADEALKASTEFLYDIV